MNHNLANMLKVAEGRYLATAEKELFKSYYEGLPARLAHAEDIEKQEAAIIKQTADTFYAKFPNMLQISDSRAKTERDMAYLLRTVTNAMVQQDYTEAIPKVRFIFDIFDRLNFESGSMAFAYATLQNEVKNHVSNDAYQSMESFLNLLHPVRLDAWKELQQKQSQLIKKLSEHVLSQYPEVQNMHSPEENLRRDMEALLNACGEAMVSQSLQPVRDIKHWLFAFFKGLQFEMDVVHSTYAKAPDLFQEELSEATLTLLKPALEELTRD